MTKLYYIQLSKYFTPHGTELFSIMEQLLPIKFVLDMPGSIKADGVIVSESSPKEDAAGTPSLSLPLIVDPTNKSQQIETEVRFADDPDVPFPFRGRALSTKLAQVVPVLSIHTNEKVLATSKQGPIWIVSEIGGVKHFRSVLTLPNISVEDNFNDVFNGECFLEMLVLLQFVREISANTVYQNPPLRAGFIIDDPNLHWTRYGFVDYREIIVHAQKENYHVSFATIPLDTWFTHAATADLFRTNSRWLSLLIHGNNHAKAELAQDYSEGNRKGLLQQAIQRINCLEQKANLHVSKVMVPPHGACSNEMLAELSMCGFESACISPGSLRAHNRNKSWTKTLGFFPSEIINGCPVLPRWGLTGNVENTLLLAAYLGQPMILRGHHQDFRNGVEMFDEFAKFINSLGDVFWSNMTDLSQLNYLWRMEGTMCRVKPLGINVVFELPSNTTEVIVEKFGANDDFAWRAVLSNGSMHKIEAGEHFALTEKDRQGILLKRVMLRQHPASYVPINPYLILRRLLTEARDRFLIT